MNGISALIIRDTREIMSLHHVRYSKKASICKPGEVLSPRNQAAITLILDFQLPDCEKQISVV